MEKDMKKAACGWTVLKEMESGFVLARCNGCGCERRISASAHRKGKSNGCSRCRYSLTNNATHGMSKTPTYRSWSKMIIRCENSKDRNYPRYGGRGITVCDRWRHSFVDFLADMGERPSGCTIDRIDVNGNYEPLNCRWATNAQQMRNRRNTIICPLSAVLMRQIWRRGNRQIDIAHAFGVSKDLVGDICRGTLWNGAIRDLELP